MEQPEDTDASEPSGGQTPARSLTNRWARMAAIDELRRRQSLVVSRRQLRTAGWTRYQIDQEIDVGRWQSPAPAVVVMHTGELNDEQSLWLGLLHAGDGAVLSHLTAARRAHLRWTAPDLIGG